MKHDATIQRARGSVDWSDAFLSSLEETGVVVKACESAQVSRSSVWRRRQDDPEFAKRYEESLKSGALLLEAEAIRRASGGLIRKKFTKSGAPIIDPETGEQYVEREYSDTLLALLLRRHIPEYREPKADVNVNNSVHNHLYVTENDLAKLQERRRQLMEKSLNGR
jgi:hypothetical protein